VLRVRVTDDCGTDYFAIAGLIEDCFQPACGAS
jgi:hypothetical protein